MRGVFFEERAEASEVAVAKRDSRGNVERYDTYAALFTGSKNGVSVHKLTRAEPPCLHLGSTPAVHRLPCLRILRGARYHWGR